MRKLITKNKEIKLGMKHRVDSDDLSNNTQDIKLVGDEHIDLKYLNLNIVKYEETYDHNILILIGDCNINKLILNGNRWLVIKNSTINDIYIQSEIRRITFRNTNIPNLHGRVDLINEIQIE